MGRGQGRPQRLYSGVERRPAIETRNEALCRRIDESGQLSDEDREMILKLSREFLTRFQTEAAEKSGE